MPLKIKILKEKKSYLCLFVHLHTLLDVSSENLT